MQMLWGFVFKIIYQLYTLHYLFNASYIKSPPLLIIFRVDMYKRFVYLNVLPQVAWGFCCGSCRFYLFVFAYN